MATDLAERVVLITGGTDGIGRAAAVRLASRGATVLVHGRDEAKAERALAAVRDASAPADGRYYPAEFADRDAVWSLARRVRESHDRLDVLVNNAGTWQDERRPVDGWGGRVEYTIAVNHLAPFLLTNLLVPVLRESAPARVVTVSSALHRRATVDPETFLAQPDFDGRRAYAESKLANVLFTRELADRLAGSGVTANALHPGAIPATSLARNASGLSRLAWKAMGLLPFVTDRPQDGGRTVEYVAASPAIEGVTGAYFADESEKRPAPASEDERLRAELWTLSAERTGLSAEVPDVDPLAGQ